jgi:hypothetical protein
MKIKKRLQAPKLLTLAVNDRIMMPFAAVHLSASGTKRTSVIYGRMSAIGVSGHRAEPSECPPAAIAT